MQHFSHIVSGLWLFALIAISSTAYGQDETALDTDDKLFSYTVGVQVGLQLKQQFEAEANLDFQTILSGLTDVLLDQELRLSEEEMFQAIRARQLAIDEQAADMAQMKLEATRDFLNDYREKDGVTMTDSGLLYTVIESGDPEGTTPDLQDTVVVHYLGKLLDNTVFDSSYDRGEPASFSLRSIIPGWQEALQLMRPGDKWELVIPPELAYGAQGAGQLIGPNEALVFEVDLLEIKKPGNTE